MNRCEIKAMAKEQLKGNIGAIFVVLLIIAVISGLASVVAGLIPGIGAIALIVFISAPFELSVVMIFLNLTKGKSPEIKDTFSGYEDFFSAFKVIFFASLFSFLWSFLFIIPGIIKAISYSMSMYILAENKGMSALDAINKSKKMMDGHKMDYFILGLSFIGWFLLVYITLGIAAIWVAPYMETTFANFYNKLKENTEEKVEVIDTEYTEI